MARTTISFESGTADATLNSSNTPAGASQVDITGTPTSIFSSTTPAVGALCWSLTATTAGDIARIRRSGLSVTSLATRYYFRLRAAVSASGAVIGESRDTSSAVIFNHVLNTANSLSVVAKTGGATTLGTLSLNTWYRIEAELTKGSSSTTGVWTTRVYVGNDTTALYTQSSSAADLGTANLSQFNIGKNSGTPTLQADYDDFVVDDGTTTPIGPPASNVPPTANGGADQYVQRGSVATVTGTDADTDGTIVSRSWTVQSALTASGTFPTLTGANTATASFTTTDAGVYFLQYAVTDNSGATGSATLVRVNVYPQTGEDVAVLNVVLGSWTKYGSASTALVGLNDNDATTGVLSPTNPTTGQLLTMYLNPMGPGAVKLYISGRWIDAAVTRTVTLYKTDGTTVVKTWTMAPTNSDAEVELVVDSAGLALIPSVTDRAGLVLKIAAAVA